MTMVSLNSFGKSEDVKNGDTLKSISPKYIIRETIIKNDSLKKINENIWIIKKQPLPL